MFSCKFCKISKDIFFYRTPPVAASDLTITNNNKYIKVNSDKSRLLKSENKKAIANIDDNCIKSEDVHELLGITIDSKLTFEIFEGKSSSFNEPLVKDNSVLSHHKNVQAVATEMYKISNDVSPTTPNDILHQITCVNQLVLKCKEYTWSKMVLQLYPI